MIPNYHHRHHHHHHHRGRGEQRQMISHGSRSFHHDHDPSFLNSEADEDIVVVRSESSPNARSPHVGTTPPDHPRARRESVYCKSPHHGREILMNYTTMKCHSPCESNSSSTTSFIMHELNNPNAMRASCSSLRSPECSSCEAPHNINSRVTNLLHSYGHDERMLHVTGSKWEDADKWINGNGCTNSRTKDGVNTSPSYNYDSLQTKSPQNTPSYNKDNYLTRSPLNIHSFNNDCLLTRSPRHFSNHNTNPHPHLNDNDIMIKSYPHIPSQIAQVDCINPTTKSIANILDIAPLPTYIQTKKGHQSKMIDVNKHIIVNHELEESKLVHRLQGEYCNSHLSNENNAQPPPNNYAMGRQVPLPMEEEYRKAPYRDEGSDRFGSRESHVVGNSYVDMMSKGHFIKDTIVISKLREVGTQITSVDGSTSTSRYPSKNGSPIMSPARHNTPARIRSMRLSSNSDNNALHQQMHEYRLDVEEVVYCHRAKLELQELSEGEHIGQSFHWTSREAEEADLSTSLRHYDNYHNDIDYISIHPKLAKLRQKEEKIEAWEKHTKEKANAQLKKLEEQLEKKRLETTNKILEKLAITRRKAEEKRANILTQQKKVFVKPQRHRRSPSPSPTIKGFCFNFIAEP